MSADANAAVAPGKQVVCVMSVNERVTVDVDVLSMAHTFATMYKDLNCGEDPDFEFKVANVEACVFLKVVEWCKEHEGQPDPVIEQDPNIREIPWVTFIDYEKYFFEVPVDELQELVMATNNLDVKTLYLHGCPAIAALIEGKTPVEVRALFELEDDLTEEEKVEIRKQNPWCNH